MATQQERRLSQRTKMDRLAYIELPSGNGGIVKDISDGGLGFCAVAPPETSTSIPVSIRVPFSGGLQRVATTGDLVWTDDSRKSGGLRFLDLAEESRAQICRWRLELSARSATVERTNFACPAVRAFEGAANNAGLPPSYGARNGHLQQFRTALQPKARPAERRTSTLLMIGISCLAGVIGFMSNTWYREMHARLDSDAKTQTSQPPSAPARALASGAPSTVAFASNLAAPKGALENTPAQVLAPALAEAAQVDPQDDFLFVQIGVYSKQAEAQSLLEKLRQNAFVAYAEPANGAYRVQLGPYITAEAAEMARSALQNAGFNSFIRESPRPPTSTSADEGQTRLLHSASARRAAVNPLKGRSRIAKSGTRRVGPQALTD